jgi:hypothetical protein
VTEGENFWLTSYLTDIRPGGKGVFAAYFDIQYQDNLVSVTGAPIFVSPYVNATNVDSSTAGLVDEIGSAASLQELFTSEYPQFRLPMKATTAGLAIFVSEPADESPQHDVLVYDRLDPVTDRQINYGSSVLTILPQQGSGEGEAEGEAAARAALLDVVFRTPSPTTAAARLSLSDWSLPGRSEPVAYQQAVDDTMRTLAWEPQPLLARSGDQRYDMQDDADELADLIDELAADMDGWNQQ